MKKLVSLLFVLLFSSLFAQYDIDDSEKAICEKVLGNTVDNSLKDKFLNEVMITIAKGFIGTEYEAGTLDNNQEEKLVVHLSGLDCYTLVDNTIALGRAVKFGESKFEPYLAELEKVRYRDGKMDGYISRLHYVTDWIGDLSKRGILKDMTRQIGGEPYDKKINFMSVNFDKYDHLSDNPGNVEKIKKIEDGINATEHYYVPQDRISEVESKINDGDVIALTTSIQGLDIVHVGFAIREADGRIHFLHAPNAGYKVQITSKPLADYVKGVKSQTGIMVFRGVE